MNNNHGLRGLKRFKRIPFNPRNPWFITRGL